jgi:hypothetical protein
VTVIALSFQCFLENDPVDVGIVDEVDKMLKTAGDRFAIVAECTGMPAYNWESIALSFERIRIRA